MWKVLFVLITALALGAGCKTDSSGKEPATPDQIQPAAAEGEKGGAEEPKTTGEPAAEEAKDDADEADPAEEAQPAQEAEQDDPAQEKRKPGEKK